MNDKEILKYMNKLIANEKRNFTKLSSYYEWCSQNRDRHAIIVPENVLDIDVEYGIKKLVSNSKKDADAESNKNIVRFTTSNLGNKKIEYNAYIKIPYDYHACGYKWVLGVGKIIDNSLTKSCYANRLTNENNKNDIFKFFVKSYNDFRDNALKTISKLHDENESVIVFNYDLTRYFYNIDLEKLFDMLDELLLNEELTKEQIKLNDFVKKVIMNYGQRSPNKEIPNIKKLGLPIEFAPSNVLSNLYLKGFDEFIRSCNPCYYGRYVDDMILVFKYIPGKEHIDDYIQKYKFDDMLKELGLLDKDKKENEKIKTFIFENSNKNHKTIDIFRDYLNTFSSDFNKMINIYNLDDEIKKNCFNTIGLNNKLSSIEEVKLKSIEFAKIISTLEYIIFNGLYNDANETGTKNLFETQIKYIIDSCDDTTLIERYDYWASIHYIEEKLGTKYFKKRVQSIKKNVNYEQRETINRLYEFVKENNANYVEKKKLAHEPMWLKVFKKNSEGKM